MGVIKNQTPLRSSALVDITHTKGEVILLDFWATWCPPCQKPMAHNQEMLSKRKDWGSRVRLIGLSIDQSQATVANHVDNRGWTAVEHYHSRNGVSDASKIYGVTGVPRVLLVDTEGTIVFTGHPSSRKLEEDIDTLLKGDKITGPGAFITDADSKPTSKESSPEQYTEVTESFKTSTQ